MALVNYTIEELSPVSVIATWANMQDGDTGAPLPISGFAYKSVEASGTQGVGGEMKIQVSDSVETPIYNDNVVIDSFPYISSGTNLVPGLVRPNITGGNGSTNLTLTLEFIPVETTV